MGEDARSLGDGGAGQAARESQRIDVAAARQTPSTIVGRTAEMCRDLVPAQNLGGDATRLPLLGASCGDARTPLGVSRLNPAVAYSVAINAILGGCLEQKIGRSFEKSKKTVTPIRPQCFQNSVGIAPRQGRNDLTIVPAGGSCPDLARLDHQGLSAGPCEMQSGREAGNTGTNDGDIGLVCTLETRGRESLAGQGG